MEKEKEFYLLQEASTLLNVSVRTLRAWIKKGELAATKKGNFYYVFHEDIIKFLKTPSQKPISKEQ